MGRPQEPLYQPYAEQHIDTSGPDDKRPSWQQILKDAGKDADLKGKVAIVTGCSGGIGAETAAALYEAGAQVYATARDMAKVESIIEGIVSKSEVKAPRPQALELSLDSLTSVRKAAETFKKQSDRLDILIESAGVMCTPYGLTEDGFETHFGTNHLGHFLFFELLKPLLFKTAADTGEPTRAVIVSSAGHRRGPVVIDDPHFKNREYTPIDGYCQSKTANIWMANEADRRYASQGLRVVSVHPGMIWTDIARHLSTEQLNAMGVNTEPVKRLEKSPNQGAATSVWAAISPYFKDHGGLYLGDCGVCSPGASPVAALYSPHAYDEDGEKKLWKLSCEAVGVVDN